jgi:hypothetical protein
MSEYSQQFLQTLHKTKNVKRSLQALYNTGKPPEELAQIVKESSAELPGLDGVGQFDGYKTTKSWLHKRRLTEKNRGKLKEDTELAANLANHRRKLNLVDDILLPFQESNVDLEQVDLEQVDKWQKTSGVGASIALASEAVGLGSLGRLVGSALDAVKPPTTVDRVIRGLAPTALVQAEDAYRAKSAAPTRPSMAPVAMEPTPQPASVEPPERLTVVEAAAILGGSFVQTYAEAVVKTASLPATILSAIAADKLGGIDAISGYAKSFFAQPSADNNDDRTNFTGSKPINNDDRTNFTGSKPIKRVGGFLPQRRGMAAPLSQPNGAANQIAYDATPVTSRISPLVQQILSPQGGPPRPPSGSQPEQGRLAQQGFENYVQDASVPYAVR